MSPENIEVSNFYWEQLSVLFPSIQFQEDLRLEQLKLRLYSLYECYTLLKYMITRVRVS